MGTVEQVYSLEEPTCVPIVYIFAIKYLNALLSSLTLRVIIKFVKEFNTLHAPLFSKICDDLPRKVVSELK